MSTREKNKEVTWYLRFAFERNFKDLKRKDKEELDQEVIEKFYRPNAEVTVVTPSAESVTGWWPFQPSTPIPEKLIEELSAKLRYFFEKIVFPNNQEETPIRSFRMIVFENKNDDPVLKHRDFDPAIDHFAINPFCKAAGHWWVFNSIETKDPLLIAQWQIIKSISDCPWPCFAECAYPKCKRWFFNPRKKEQHYCSKNCSWSHKALLRKDSINSEEYKKGQRIRVQFSRLKDKGFTPKQVKSSMAAYLKKQQLSPEEENNWLEWCGRRLHAAKIERGE